MKQIRQNFIYPEYYERDKKYSANFFAYPIVRADGDWRKDLPPEEEQRRDNLETSACYTFAQLHSDATFQEAIFGEKDVNKSDRFNALLSEGTPNGGDPLKAADSIYSDGTVEESSMPLAGDSWDDYHSWKGVDEKKVRAEGQEDKKLYERRSGVLFGKDTPLDTKYGLIEQALYRGVPCVSVWGVQDGDTYSNKPQGVRDTHFVEVCYLDKDKKQIHIWDTYPPFYKILPANYNPDFGLGRLVVKKNVTEGQIGLTVLETLLSFGLVQFFIDWWKKFTSQPVNPPAPLPPPVPPKPVSYTEKLIEAINFSIGKDVSPSDEVKDEFGCAESMSAIIHSVYPTFPNKIFSTKDLVKLLDGCAVIERVKEPSAGVIIVSPRTEVTFGHTGGFVDDFNIVSNDSGTGLMKKNYNWPAWIKEFKNKRGLQIILFKFIS